LGEKLIAERSGILNWLIEGVERWREKGLATPMSVKNATDDYQGDMDAVGNFMRDMCVKQVGAKVKLRTLFETYQNWCDENGEKPSSERFFGMRLKEMGLEQKRTGESRFWVGIGIRADE
jgi:putative DNA primase/helicase